MKKIIVAIDSFKGSLTSAEANAAVRDGLLQALPGTEVTCLPISDGGEGLVAVLTGLTHGRYLTRHVTGPCGETVAARIGLSGIDDGTAFIELASAAGLPLVPPQKRNPLHTTTRGVGELMLEALRLGKRRLILGIGGSATNDAGTGLLAALGYRFLDKSGQELPATGASLAAIARVDASRCSPLLDNAVIEVACDVTNPFYGPLGAACVFAPQKGADPHEVGLLDEGLRSFARLIREVTGTDVAQLPGAGAAGGVGGALAAFLHARLHPGIDFILDALRFDELLDGADLVISGEGHADRQSAMGKVVSGILRWTIPRHKPLILFCGGYEDAAALNAAGITAVFSITPGPVTLAQAMDKPFALRHLTETARQAGNVLACFS